MNDRIHLLLLLVAACWFSACATQNENAEEEVRLGPVQQLNVDVGATDPKAAVKMRFNPVDCDCTPWEAWVAKRWVRVALTLDDEEAEAALQEAADTRSSYQMVGNLNGDPLMCTPSTLCLSMTVLSWERLEPTNPG